jgi:hypothetical protein
MVEASFDLGRRLVLEALVQNRATQIPIAGPLRLLSPWLWGTGGADALPPQMLPDVDGVADEAIATSGQLLAHPAFLGWSLPSEATLQAAAEILRQPGQHLEVWVRRLAGELFAEPDVIKAVSRRLEAMSEWLLLAGNEHQSRLAFTASKAALEEPPQDQPFLQAIVRRDLDLALHSLQRSSGLLAGAEQL